jgi:hypothetical protein
MPSKKVYCPLDQFIKKTSFLSKTVFNSTDEVGYSCLDSSASVICGQSFAGLTYSCCFSSDCNVPNQNSSFSFNFGVNSTTGSYFITTFSVLVNSTVQSATSVSSLNGTLSQAPTSVYVYSSSVLSSSSLSNGTSVSLFVSSSLTTQVSTILNTIRTSGSDLDFNLSLMILKHVITLFTICLFI